MNANANASANKQVAVARFPFARTRTNMDTVRARIGRSVPRSEAMPCCPLLSRHLTSEKRCHHDHGAMDC